MTRIANRLFLFAAAALSLGTAAYGQNILTADVPFAFHTTGSVSSPGKYIVQLRTGGTGQVVHIYNSDTHRSIMSVAYNLSDRPLVPIKPRLVFLCQGRDCRLSQVWTNDGGFALPSGHARRDPEFLASVPLSSGK
jgi:hypothetical protein